jgi:hypothetical protein
MGNVGGLPSTSAPIIAFVELVVVDVGNEEVILGVLPFTETKAFTPFCPAEDKTGTRLPALCPTDAAEPALKI